MVTILALIMQFNPRLDKGSPGRLRVGEARCAERRDEDLRGAPFAGEPVDHHRHAVARIVDEQLVAGWHATGASSATGGLARRGAARRTANSDTRRVRPRCTPPTGSTASRANPTCA